MGHVLNGTSYGTRGLALTALLCLSVACGISPSLLETNTPAGAQAGQDSATSPRGGEAASGGSAQASASAGALSPAADVAVGLQQSGSGWSGDVNVAATSKQYQGLSLDQLEASGSGLAQALTEHPDVEKAIRQVATETGVPAGLLAGLCYQESSLDPNSVSQNPNPTAEDPRDVGITQAPQPDFQGDTWRDPLTNLRVFVNKYFLPDYRKYGNWGEPLRIWNSGQVLDSNNLRKENNNTDPNYLTEILATHCMGLD